ncbi:hypothetical protein [Streptomyces sp. NBC_01006]|uniref:hypothetical protein n=1 Tax=Streptomyces sp. NBC_01006 TaxID=2903716 RepID=UPI0038652F6C|nr:hypothetical protein OG509_30795 [Streptomyces sp. NBC_01006]
MHNGARKKTVNPSAYLALVEALTLIFWNKKPFELYLRGMLQDHSELLARLDFGATKREVSGQVVNLLRANEARYLDLTIALMLDITAMDTFPNLLNQVDGDDMVAKAAAAVTELRRWTAKQQEVIQEHEAHAAAITESVKKAQDGRAFAHSHEELKQQFLVMHSAGDPHKRGTAFEGFINELFALYDLEPRASYSLDHEQIDGAFSFNTDHYVLEAKWWKEAIGRRELDVYALAVYSYSTPFITMDGSDFMAVLDQRIRLDDLLERKKGHASQTGHCYLPVSKIFSGSE